MAIMFTTLRLPIPQKVALTSLTTLRFQTFSSVSQAVRVRSLQLHLYTMNRTLSTEQQADLVDMFKVLPPQMQELDLAGFLWTGAAKALAAAQQPILQRLSLNLESIPGAWMAPVKLTANFPALLHIHIPARWCPQNSWVSEAYKGSKLEHIVIGFAELPDPLAGGKELDLHPCSRTWLTSCHWNTDLRDLFVASSLTNLTISTISFPTSSVVHHLGRVTTITSKCINLHWDDDLLNKFVGPLATLSITGLHFIDCYRIPQTLARWFEYTVQSRQFFPALKELEAGQLYTQADGEDFDEWDSEGDIISEGGNVWQPEVRRKLEQDCEMLDIDAAFDWIWFEGFG